MSFKFRLLSFLILLSSITCLASALISFKSLSAQVEERVSLERDWLKKYSSTLLDDLKVGRLLHVERKIKSLLEGKVYSDITMLYGDRSFIFKREVEKISPILPFFRFFNLEKTHVVDIKDSFGTVWGSLFFKVSDSYLSKILEKAFWDFVSLFGGLFLISIGFSIFLSDWLTKPVEQLIRKLSVGDFHYSHHKDEIHILNDVITSYISESKRIQVLELERSTNKGISSIALQVVHDIRSPLAALRSIQSYLIGTPEDIRIIFRESLNRINDIANSLSLKNFSEEESKIQDIHIYGLIERILSEKRIEFKGEVEISHEYSETESVLDSFVSVDVIEFKRVLSNLINNSVESYESFAKVRRVNITLDVLDSRCHIEIKDYGRGIPDNILKILGTEQLSYKKVSGTGLGLKHAFQVMKENSGLIEIISNPTGTTVLMSLPVIERPSWFTSHLVIKRNCNTIIIVDDDVVIHGIWKRRFKNIPWIVLVHHYSPETFLHDQASIQSIVDGSAFVLCDYEFHNSNKTGLDIFDLVQSHFSFYLVTSYFDDFNILSKVKERGAKLIPKFLASQIKLELNASAITEIVLIDDDKLIQSGWKLFFSKLNIQLTTYFTVQDFLEKTINHSVNSIICIDSNLGHGVVGEIESEKILKAGYEKLYICTGFQASDIQKPHWILKVLTKHPQDLYNHVLKL